MTSEVTAIKRVKWVRVLRRSAAILGLLIAGFLGLTPTGRYLLRAAFEEGKILMRRKPIAQIIADPATPQRLRDKLELVLAARQFAHDSLDLRTGNSFTTFSRIDHDTLVLVLSAAFRDKLRSYTWWFPVVGRVPYKGYFDFDEARRQERALADRGFDARLGAASAFSTLGWFNDPLLPTTLRADSLALAETVIHELTHNTYYAPSGAVFNESFANFVGSRGAEEFLRVHGLPTRAAEQAARWEDDKVLGRFWAGLYRKVDSVFNAHPGETPERVAERIALRDSIYAQARESLVHDIAPQLRTVSPQVAERVHLDNAVLMAQRVYRTGLDDFDAVLVNDRGNLRQAIKDIIAAAQKDTKDPFGALRRLAAGSR